MKPVSSLFRVFSLLAVFLSFSTFVLADEGSLDWYHHYHGADDEHTSLSGCLDNSGSLLISFCIYDMDHVNSSWLIQKYDGAGTMVWERELLSGQNLDGGSYITTDNDGNVYATASWFFQGYGTMNKVFKLDSAGNEIWNTIPDSSMSYVKGIHYRDDGYVITVGNARSAQWHVVSQYAADDMSGTVLWDAEIDQIDEHTLSILKFSGIDNDNRITLMGRINGTSYSGVGWVRFLENGIQDVSGSYFYDGSNITFEGSAALNGDGKLYGLVGIDNYSFCNLLGINIDGTIMWENDFEAIMYVSNVASIILDQGSPVVALKNNEGTIRCAKYTSDSGSELWVANSTTTFRDFNTTSLALGDNGGVYVAGWNVNADEPSAVIKMSDEAEEWAFFFGETDTYGSTGGHPGFLEFNNGGLIGASVISASYIEDYGVDVYRIESVTSNAPEMGNTLPSEFTVDTYPNPFNATVNIKLNLPVRGDVKVRLLNVLGQTVYQSQQTIGNGTHSLSLNAEDFTSGLYLLEVADGNGSRLVKRVTLLK